MSDDLEKFLEDQRAKVAEDKAYLELDLPYMEIRRKDGRSLKNALKENIPPAQKAQQDEGVCFSLPLGEDYERKKHKLQQELRIDYRRYMAQRKNQGSGETCASTSVTEGGSAKGSTRPPPQVRDAATLTEDWWEDLWLRRPAEPLRDPCGSEEDHSEEELLLPSDRRQRRAYYNAYRNTKRRQELADNVHKTRPQNRGLRERLLDPAVEEEFGLQARERPPPLTTKAQHGRDRTGSTANQGEADLATGLWIGSADADVALQRKKERYKQELQEQIAEQQRNRRDRDLRLKAAVTSETDPEKQPCPVGVGTGGRRPVVARFAELQEAGDRQQQSGTGRPGGGATEPLPPEDLRRAYRSPLLEYSSALGLNPDNTSPPRVLFIPPYPPSTMTEANRTPHDDAYYYYGSRNPLDPSLSYYGTVSYPPVPSAGPQPPRVLKPSTESYAHTQSLAGTSAGTGLAEFPAEQAAVSKDSALSYKEALKQQIAERAERRRVEREERQRWEAQLEVDMRAHEPWGRGGGGAPLRDSTGNPITDLNQMHRLNSEAYLNSGAQRQERPSSSQRMSGFSQAHSPQFVRGSVFNSQHSAQQILEQDKYKAYLKQQIEEKQRRQAEEKERLKLEEEREERRLAEQRERIQREYQEEMERKKRKEMEQKAKNEELIRLAEERRKEAERKKKEEEEKENAALRKQQEKERQARLQHVPRKLESPPIPTLQRGQKQHHPPSTPDRSHSGLQSPPVPARRNQIRAEEARRGVMTELWELRRQLRREQKRLEGQLLQAQWPDLCSPLTDRRKVDVFDMARLRMPARGPSPRMMELISTHKAPHTSEHTYRDADIWRDSSAGYGDIESRAAQRQQHRTASHQRANADDLSELSMPLPQTPQSRRSGMRDGLRGSQLLSESAFIDECGAAFPMPPDTPPKPTGLSARERRRFNKRREFQQERAVCRAVDSRQSEQSFTMTTNTTRKKKPSRRSITRGEHFSDEDGDPDDFTPLPADRQGTAETVAMEPWIKLDSSGMLKRITSGPSKKDLNGTSAYHG